MPIQILDLRYSGRWIEPEMHLESQRLVLRNGHARPQEPALQPPIGFPPFARGPRSKGLNSFGVQFLWAHRLEKQPVLPFGARELCQERYDLLAGADRALVHRVRHVVAHDPLEGRVALDRLQYLQAHVRTPQELERFVRLGVAGL